MGPEKARKFFKQGEILYWPLKGAICVAIGDGIPLSQVNQIGNLTEGSTQFGEIRSGVRVRISKGVV